MKPLIMKRLLVPLLALLCSAPVMAKPGAPPEGEPVLAQLRKEIDKLSATDGFSDEDAKKASLFLLEKMLGPVPEGAGAGAGIEPSKPGYVKVFASYSFGVIFSGYYIEFYRGADKKSAYFHSMTHVRSE